jgi:hypothetical protein
MKLHEKRVLKDKKEIYIKKSKSKMVFSHGLKTHGIFPWYFEK